MPTPLSKLRQGSTIYTDYYYRVDRQEETDFGTVTHLKHCKTGEVKVVSEENYRFKLIIKK